MNTLDIVAYKGDVELEESRWCNAWGMTVKVKLEQRPHELNAANPFKKYSRMRKNRVGTRFQAVFAAGEDDISYNDEVMLKGWSDGTTGWKLTLWIHANDDGLHPFMDSQKGTTYGLVMVELDDDNVAINQKKRDRVEAAKDARKHGYRLSSYAAMLCREPQFMQWLNTGPHDEIFESEEQVATWMRNLLSIESRADLDHSEAKAQMFHEEVRKPYSKWSGER
jgi:hypothetical protein